MTTGGGVDHNFAVERRTQLRDGLDRVGGIRIARRSRGNAAAAVVDEIGFGAGEVTPRAVLDRFTDVAVSELAESQR